MQLLRGWAALERQARSECGPSTVTIGSFDGLHRGHLALLEQVVRRARTNDSVPTLVTFEPHPRALLSPGSEPRRISRWTDRVPPLRAVGIRRVVVLRFDRTLAAMAPDDFIDALLVRGLAARDVFVGGDFRFGHRAAGDVPRLRRLGDQHGFGVHVIEDVVDASRRVSSSRVRACLADGQLDTAAALLGRPFQVTGRVIHGEQIGRQLGYRTANLALGNWEPPLSGVFAVRARAAAAAGPATCARSATSEATGRASPIAPDDTVGGMANVGMRPTVGGLRRLLEVHLFDFDGDLYGRRLAVEFVSKLRAEQRFDGLEALKAQLGRDAEAARAALGLAVAGAQ